MRDERRQTRLLVRTFFSRTFESDLMPPGVPQVRVVLSVFSFLAGPSLILPLLLGKKYVGMMDVEAIRTGAAWDRTMALLLSMTAAAFVTLVVWDNLFPDRRDCRALGVLPVRARTFVVARLGAIAGLFSLLFLATAAIQAAGFGAVGAMSRLPEGFLRIALAHFAAVAGAEAFVFFGIVMVQCALLNAAGPRAAQRLAVVMQVALVVAVMQLPIFLPSLDAFAVNDGGAPKWAGTPAAALFAPLWFLSLYHSLIGLPYAGAAHLSTSAALLGAGTPLAALGFYAASYRRLTRRAIEGRPEPKRLREPPASRLVSSLSRGCTAGPVGTAVCAFTLRTLARCRQHRMILAMWIGVALALTLSAAVPFAVRGGWAVLDSPRAPLLAGPLIFAALIQTGIRSLLAIPVEIRANWAFRASGPARLTQALDGASAALVLCGAGIPALLAFATALPLWGAATALQHAVFCGLVSFALTQALMRGVDRVPFTCIYTPGTAHIGTLWPLYLTLFSLVTYAMASLEATLLGRPLAFGGALVVLGLLAGVLRWLRVRAARELIEPRFDEEPADLSLSLSN